MEETKDLELRVKVEALEVEQDKTKEVEVCSEEKVAVV